MIEHKKNLRDEARDALFVTAKDFAERAKAAPATSLSVAMLNAASTAYLAALECPVANDPPPDPGVEG